MAPIANIRQARTDDAAAVSGLMAELGYSIESAAVKQKLSDSRHDPGNAAFVAEVNGIIVGVLSIHVLPLLHAEGSFGTITSLAVTADHRRQGIGSQLLRHAEAFARKSGCVGIGVASADRRTDAHAFYKMHGFTRDTEHTRFGKQFTSP